MQRLGLTGGIGSGKSTVAAMLASLGAAVIDADANARSVTAMGGEAIPAIRAAFGDDFIGADGALDRTRMREHVFATPAAKQRLESIVHPLVGEKTRAQLEQARSAGHTLAVLDIPLLVESSRWRQQLDHVLVIDCLPATQIRRVMQRSQLDEAAVQSIIAAQATRAARLAAADAVIFNDGITLEQLREQTTAAARRFGL
ncbi:dephospho-CoA kinase [Variovorax sp. VNK109]|uniref:dephospho-CoA kinase n=1 Tax=Variovorax sp. VNK109 TaxID=3400919 RepID=UPI003C00D1B2